MPMSLVLYFEESVLICPKTGHEHQTLDKSWYFGGKVFHLLSVLHLQFFRRNVIRVMFPSAAAARLSVGGISCPKVLELSKKASALLTQYGNIIKIRV